MHDRRRRSLERCRCRDPDPDRQLHLIEIYSLLNDERRLRTSLRLSAERLNSYSIARPSRCTPCYSDQPGLIRGLGKDFYNWVRVSPDSTQRSTSRGRGRRSKYTPGGAGERPSRRDFRQESRLAVEVKRGVEKEVRDRLSPTGVIQIACRANGKPHPGCHFGAPAPAPPLTMETSLGALLLGCPLCQNLEFPIRCSIPTFLAKFLS
jgi:hypothetical protein